MKYVLVTLIGGHKLYSMPKFWEHVQALNIQPELILVSCTKEIFDEAMLSYSGSVEVQHVHGKEDLGDDRIWSTTSAREALRNKLIEIGTEWTAWLDNDMLVPKDYVEKFTGMVKNTDVCWVNAFHPARHEEGKIRHGLGDSWIRLDLLEAVPFVRVEYKGKHLGDDYIWKIIVHQLSRIYKNELKYMSGRFFDVKHLTKEMKEHTFTEDQRDELV